jgi:hypothetical protein
MRLPLISLLPPLLLLLVLPPPPGGVGPPFGRSREGVAPLAAGVHAPNRAWEEADFGRMAEGSFGGVKMMSYHRPADYARLLRDTPGLDFAVRLDSPWNELPPPADFVAFHAPRLRALVDAGFSPWVEIGNEPNLELHPGAEVAFNAWYLETLRALRREAPQLRYGFPGLAVDQRELEWLEANAEAIGASDWLGVHAYWATEREMLDPRRALKLVQYHRRFPHLPILVTEAGNTTAGLPPAERARQYARFTRTVARFPYVRALHYFILSGTRDWRHFFFDDLALAAVRDAPREPAPLVAGLAGLRQEAVAVLLPLVSGPGGLDGAPSEESTGPRTPAPPVPTAAPSRRRLIADPAPAPMPPGAPAVPHATGGRWVGGETGLRSASAYFATDFSLRLLTAPPAGGAPFAVQIADDARGTGFALLWDGEAWRLQYRRAGEVLEDHPLQGVREPPPGGRLRVELALEPRSAAAWVWPAGEPQPGAPQAVFAPPPDAGPDAARPRHVVLPAPRLHPVADVSLEGLTRFS